MGITKITKTLEDGSKVFDVLLSDDDGDAVLLQAVTEQDAEHLLRGLRVLIAKHTNEPIDDGREG